MGNVNWLNNQESNGFQYIHTQPMAQNANLSPITNNNYGMKYIDDATQSSDRRQRIVFTIIAPSIHFNGGSSLPNGIEVFTTPLI